MTRWPVPPFRATLSDPGGFVKSPYALLHLYAIVCARCGLSLQKEGRRMGRPSATAWLSSRLLDLDAAAGLLELGLELVGLVLLDALLDGLRGLVDKRLGLLQAQAGRRADDLDDLDLLVAGGGQ